ncbi:hypothetical protein [Streptomyces sp. NPDC008092]|uniref:hypothetical protein n=1 Tax=Streptomyces sp. NPDC008092 TaxID=3364808 RepID=UPI0036E4CE0A
MAPTEKQPLTVFDLFDQPLSEGDKIAFTSKDNDAHYIGTIMLIGRDGSAREQIVVQSGHLVILQGRLVPVTGSRPEHIRFNQVVRRPAEGAGA